MPAEENGVRPSTATEKAPSEVPVAPGRLGLYDVGRAVGKGGYAVVYKGACKEDGKVVAIKKVEIFDMTPKKRERCLHEVILLQQLKHPHIIQMMDAFIDDNVLIIVCEYAPAGDLKTKIKAQAKLGKPLDEPQIWNLFAQVTDGLRSMHQHRIMHRDIKPANILIGANGALKLADLGLGRQLSEQTMEAFSKVGTPYYVSPEVVRGAGYDWKSDVWSMGCLLYELAVLKSPFEMEGAKLYDVFQMISKGEFSPLPADQFSLPLRQLVVRMLQIEPDKRPELDEVWDITQAVLHSQSKSRADVHSVSEDIYSQLLLLDVDISCRLNGRGNGNGGRRVDAGGLVPPPLDTLHVLHPLYFADVAAIRPHDGMPVHSDEVQKRQLGAYMQVFAWLARLCGKPDPAAVIEGHLTQVATKFFTRHRPSGLADSGRQTPPTTIKKSRSGRSGGTVAAAAVPVVVLPYAMLPSCTNVLAGAEAIKKAAQALGLSTEFASVSALAAGHGRAPCMLLQELLEKVAARLQPVAQAPVYGAQRDVDAAAAAAEEAAAADNDDELEGADADLVTAGGRRLQDQSDDEADAAVYGGGTGGTDASRRDGSGGTASTSGQAATAGGGGGGAGEGTTRVDPIKWQLECERLAPALSKIRVAETDMAGDWHYRWQQLKQSLKGLQADAPPAAASLHKVQGVLANDLERIQTAEARVNANNHNDLDRLKVARRRLDSAQAERVKHDELLELGNHALTELTGRLEEANAQIQDRTDGLDGSRPVALARDAIRKLQLELNGMSVRFGVLQQQLASRQRRQLFVNLAAGSRFEDDDDD